LVKQETIIEIPSHKKAITSDYTVLAVLNKAGNRAVDNSVHYDMFKKVKAANVIFYDAKGKEIKKFKKKDFIDVSIVSGGTLYSDDRMLYIDYVPTSYPYTVVFNYTVESKNTFYIPPWTMHTNYYGGVLSKEMQVNYDPKLTLRHKTFDPNSEIEVRTSPGSLSISAQNKVGLEPEQYGPALYDHVPNVMFALDQFNLGGLEGNNAANWKDYGQWQYDNLVKGLDYIPAETKTKITQLLEGAKDDKEKVKRIYQYLQENTRYISVQLGIGGLRPYPAAEVEELGYGDCKGLTNYMMALLASQGITSNYCVVWGGSEKRDVDLDFPSFQGNHVILNVPLEKEELWLECTSQTVPFNFLGDFTDDRDVLALTPEGGVLKRTPEYNEQHNRLITTGVCQISPQGELTADVQIMSYGIQYDNRFSLDIMDTKERVEFYKSYWDYIDNVSIASYEFQNDRDHIRFEEKVVFNARSYGTIAADKMLVPLNVFNRHTSLPDRYSNRKQGVEIERGYFYNDEIKIKLPEGYQLESIPDGTIIENDFGSYTSEVNQINDDEILYKRTVVIKKSSLKKEEYKKYRSFIKGIVRGDAAKMVLIKK